MKDYETLVCARLGSTWLTSGSVLWPATAPPSSSSFSSSSLLFWTRLGRDLLACHFKFWRVRQYVFPPPFIFIFILLFCDDFYVFLFSLSLEYPPRLDALQWTTKPAEEEEEDMSTIKSSGKGSWSLLKSVAFPPQTDRRTTQPRDDYSTCRKGKKNKKRGKKKEGSL